MNVSELLARNARKMPNQEAIVDGGETVKAFIVVKEPLENIVEECKNFLDGKLAQYKIPKLFEVINQLPRNPTGKILKTKLRA